ncbi:hypothetical protein BOTBODRAFT_37126 [Botryobasidium botryosum FD-172 SS1]|uniref:Uncharacterized protein n=1 Tax=Botryobasidium botryosum (strain FD-172 SS1) TaxID=930990 RepID=A0A067M0W7_BOTB1|nr:hypothetical protein BOTBODRAFT_37126 [Botryobasidium botryosum FD-172 SS1]
MKFTILIPLALCAAFGAASPFDAKSNVGRQGGPCISPNPCDPGENDCCPGFQCTLFDFIHGEPIYHCTE